MISIPRLEATKAFLKIGKGKFGDFYKCYEEHTLKAVFFHKATTVTFTLPHLPVIEHHVGYLSQT